MNAYSELFPELRGELDKYLDTVSAGSLHGNRAFCSRFLLLLQNEGLQTVPEIEISDLISATSIVMGYENKHDRESLLSSAKRFLIFESQKGAVFASLPLMLKYYPRNQVLFLNDFSENDHAEIVVDQQSCVCTAEEFYQCCEQVFQIMEGMNYSHWHIVNLRKIADLHYLFLSVSSLSYSKETYLIWRNLFVSKIMHGPSVIQDTNRLLGFVEQWQAYGRIIPEKNYRLKVLPYDTLPLGRRIISAAA